MSRLVYSVEDDENIGYVINKALTNTGYEVENFTNGVDLFQALEKRIPDVLLLDIMLPGESGLDILARIREDSKYEGIYVMIISAKTTELDKVVGLDQGADDYMTKPFGILELTSKINAVFRRVLDKKDVLVCQNISLYINERKCKRGDIEVNLTAKEFSLLKYLFENKPNVVTKEDIMKNVWGYDYCGETRTVDMHIKSLRQKLSDGGNKLITTVHGIGYRVEV